MVVVGETSDLVTEIHDVISKLSSRNGLRSNSGAPQETVVSLADINRRSARDAVIHAFKAILGRLPDHQGYCTYVSALRRGVLSRSQLLEALLRSPEGRGRRVRILYDLTEAEMVAVDHSDVERSYYTYNEFEIEDFDEFLRFAYRAILKRDCDSGGIESFRNAIATGATREQVLRSLLDSDEHKARTETVVISGVTPVEAMFKEMFARLDRMTTLVLDLEMQLFVAKNG
ncbi:MAG: DUF4214 domain-containing protein [Phyllobacteriaceae bacterium]|nr:DUF4214 domain-containing protein [Phyllobacteriaceae bacterium]